MIEGISVIVPTKGRIEYMKEMLLSLATAREWIPQPVQIIVVDDSAESEARVVEELCKNHSAEYFWCRAGVSDKRNFGIDRAKFPIVLFVDSDCKVDPYIFREHIRFYSNAGNAACVGLTEFTGKKTMVSKIVVEKVPFTSPHQFAKQMEYAPWGPCTNISFRRDVLNKVRGFASFLPPKEGSEDVDLGYRIQQLGYKIKCNPDAIVFHPREALGGWGGLIEREFRWGRAEAHLLFRHPENAYLDIPKVTLIFALLLTIGFFIGISVHTYFIIFLPLLWLLNAIFVQCCIAFAKELQTATWKEAISSCISVVADSIYELGTIVECLRRGKLRLLPLKFIYAEDQLHNRWYRGMAKTWSFVISFFVLIIIYAVLL